MGAIRGTLAWPLALAMLSGCAAGSATSHAAIVGRAAPSASFALADGGELSIESARGNVVMLAFFTSYCPTSPAILSAVDGFRARESTHGLTVIAVNEGDAPARVEELAAKLGVRMTFAFDKSGGAATDLGLETVPSVVLIDRRGTVRHVHGGYRGEDDRAVIDREVTALLGE